MAPCYLARNAHTRAQIKYGTQLNGMYTEASTPELSNVRCTNHFGL